jgi:hypothetical protein
MVKSESIKKLEELRFNTLDYFITKNKHDALHYLAKHAEDLISMRTERGSEYACPFHYMVKGQDVLSDAVKYLEQGYTLLFSPSLDTKGCICFGTIAMYANRDDVIEYVWGAGKVRELDNHPNKRTIIIPKGSYLVSNRDLNKEHSPIINKLYRMVLDMSYEIEDKILEWSYYAHNVGVKQHQDIWWEIREA